MAASETERDHGSHRT